MTLLCILAACALDLNGIWDFRFEEGKSIEDSPKADFAATDTMPVPGCYDACAKWRYARGTGLYRRTFRLDAAADNAWLVVEGMGLRGEFVLDGRSLGVHPYPYARLELETGPLAAGEHTLFAALDNRLDWNTMRLARHFYDFYFFGGFYRGVSLKFDNRRLLVRTRDYRTGTVEIEAENFRNRDFPATLVFDGTDKVSAAFRDGRATVRVPGFRLWSPEHPNLHTVGLEGVSARFGIRTIEAKDRRILLNGTPVFLKGVNRHEQSRGKGVTMTEEEMVRDLRILKDLGANFIRGAHYQQSQRFLDLCDEMGLLVWEESLGWGNGQGYTKTDGIDELEDGTFAEQQVAQTRGMVRASFNHPSVVIFAFLNECASGRPVCKSLVDRLISVIREQDSGRLVTFACSTWKDDICNANTDIVAFNIYPGTIPANPGTKEELRKTVRESFDTVVAHFRGLYPEKPIMVSESGCAGLFGMRDETAPFGCEDFQDEYLADIMDTLWANEDVVGYSIWQFADTTTHQRNCGNRSGRIFGISMAGIFSAAREPKASCRTVKEFFATVPRSQAKAVPGPAPSASYWCTWETQNYTIDPDRQVKTLGFVGDQGAQGARDNIDEEVLFGKDGKGGWVEACPPETRKDLYLLIDDGWDVPYLQAPGKDVSVFGSLVVDAKRFPSFTGTPAERLAKFNAAVKARGWKGLALWCATQCTGESWGGKERPAVNFDDAAVEKAWRERFRWCHEAGIGYLKFDWGARGGQVEFRRLLSRIAREVAPEILIEHCTGAVPLNEPERMFGNPAYDENRKRAKELMGFADLFRIYDLLNPFVYATAAERCAFYLEVQAEAGGRCLLSTEDEIYLGASLGCAFGVMRSPFLPDGRCPVRLQGRRMTEVDRAVAWQRLAPPFASAEKPRISKATLADSWTYPSGSTWYRKAEGRAVVQKAPAVLSRGMELPVVTSAEADGSVPFVTACRYPNGLVSVGCIPRMAEKSGIRTPKADVALAIAAPKIAVFGTIGSLTVPDGAGRVLARDLTGGTAEDLTAKCVRADGRLRIPGSELNRIGTARNGAQDLSDPGVLIDFCEF